MNTTSQITTDFVELPTPTLTAFAALRFAAFELLQARSPDATEQAEASLRNALDRLETIVTAQGVNWTMSQISGLKLNRYRRIQRAASDLLTGSTQRRELAVELRFALESLAKAERQILA